MTRLLRFTLCLGILAACGAAHASTGSPKSGGTSPTGGVHTDSLTAQTITFPPILPILPGTTSVTFTAPTASSGLPVTVTASGPGTLSGNTVTITGSGTVVLTATQAGNATYAAATNEAYITPVAGPNDTTLVRFVTTLGNIDIRLYSAESPHNCVNFLANVDTGVYASTFIHRSVPGFVVQGGGYGVSNGEIVGYGSPTVPGEHSFSNVRGTVAMALSSGPDTGTNQFFFNLVDNSSLLDGTADGGPFTAFGVVADVTSLATMDLIAAQQTTGVLGSPFDDLPVINYTPGNSLTTANLIYITSATRITSVSLANWETAYFTAAQQSTSGFTASTAEPFHDGVPNLLKYVFDINPSSAMTVTDRQALPVLGQATVNSANYLTLTYRQWALATGVTVAVQSSPDLVTWTTDTTPADQPHATGTVDATTGDSYMQARVPLTGSTRFIRLKVTGS